VCGLLRVYTVFMSLPKVSGPTTEVHTTVPFDFPSLRLVVRVRYVPGPVVDRINEAGRKINLQRMVDERSLKVAALIAEGVAPVDADSQVEPLGPVGVLIDDVAPAMIAASVDGFYVDTADESDGLGEADRPPVWEPFGGDDADELWNGSLDAKGNRQDDAWPSWAKETLYLSVRNFSQRGTPNPKAR
jgi:hypothetical protein